MAHIADAPSWPEVLDCTRKMHDARLRGEVAEETELSIEREAIIGKCKIEVGITVESDEPEIEIIEPEEETDPAIPSQKELDRKAGVARTAAKKAKAADKKAKAEAKNRGKK